MNNSPVTDYSDMAKRIPVMMGFNFPTFKMFDVLSIEGEWFGSDRPNTTDGVSANDLPDEEIFGAGGNNYPYVDSVKDHWKWSVYGKRTFAGHFSVVGQIASDHYRWELNDYQAQAQYSGVEALREPNKYYYIIKFGYNF